MSNNEVFDAVMSEGDFCRAAKIVGSYCRSFTDGLEDWLVGGDYSGVIPDPVVVAQEWDALDDKVDAGGVLSPLGDQYRLEIGERTEYVEIVLSVGTEFYLIECQPDGEYPYYRLQPQPGRKNLSHECVVEGWLGWSYGADEYALGRYRIVAVDDNVITMDQV